MAVLFRSVAVSDTNTVDKPSGTVDGDILLLFIYYEATSPATITPPSGFVAVTGALVDGGAIQGNCYWKRASGEGANYTWSGSSSAPLTLMAAYSGAIASGTPYEDADIYNASSNTVTLPSITTLTDNTLIVGKSNSFDFGATNSSSDMTERSDSNGGGLYDVAQAGAGASGTKVISLTSSTEVLGIILNLKQAAGGTTHEDSLTMNRVNALSSSPTQGISGVISLARSERLLFYSGFGAFAFGEENPTQGEERVPWPTWDDGAGGAVVVDGDPNWGKLQLSASGDDGRSRVYDLGWLSSYTFTLTRNRYGTGTGTSTLQIRGSTGSFGQDDAIVSWESYTVPLTRTWRYVQVREMT